MILQKFGRRILQNAQKPSQVHRCKSQSTAEYCLNNVRQYDYDNFTCTLLLKNSARACAFAVRGFNVEVSRVAEQVSQDTIGLMRLKFWEETVDKCFTKDVKKVPQHPVAIEIYKALLNNQLTKRYFKNLIEVRKDNLNMKHFNSLEDMEKYAEKSVSSVYYLILEGCGVKNMHADHAASHLGKAQGITQQLRSIPHSKRLNFIPLPQDILIRNNLSQEEVIRGKSSSKLQDTIFEVASRAHQHLVKARSLSESVPKEGRAALLPAVPIYSFLDRLQKVNYDVFHPGLQNRPWTILPRLYVSNLRNKY